VEPFAQLPWGSDWRTQTNILVPLAKQTYNFNTLLSSYVSSLFLAFLQQQIAVQKVMFTPEDEI